MTPSQIISLLPYTKPFLFVDELVEISDKGITGNYCFSENSFFYAGHFKNFPVTPGVILTECMAQIGVVCLGIFLLKDQIKESAGVALTETKIDFYIPVYPGEQVKVISEKIYFRFSKLKCRVQMFNSANKLVSRGEISGMIKENE